MKAYFADTSYYVALLVSHDRRHAEAKYFAEDREVVAVTSHYVLLELTAYFAKPPFRGRVIALVEALRQVAELSILPEDPALFVRGWSMYAQHQDKNWSLTDCISFVIMQDRGITDALTTDRHFVQAGFNVLLHST